MYKEKLIKYVQAKNDYIISMTSIDYITEEDIYDIMSWKEEECKQIWQTLKPKTEVGGCPWCTKHYLDCDVCSYGDRNGECGDDDSRITSIRSKAEELRIDCILTSDEIVEAYNKINSED